MSERTVQCGTHGEAHEAYVCSHLVGNSAGLGFNRGEPTDDERFPDAWCDDCELIRAAHDGWNEQSESLTQTTLICSGCYERACIRNTRTEMTFDDLASLRWKCNSCDELHTGPRLDFSYDSPYYWCEEHEKTSFLNEDFCVIENRDFFVRGIIHLPIIGTAETFRWGVWGSLSQQNFETLIKMDSDPRRTELPAMFSWLSSEIPEYPSTLSLKMYARIQEPSLRPHFELELTDHPLSREYHHGITLERVKEIMVARLPGLNQES